MNQERRSEIQGSSIEFMGQGSSTELRQRKYNLQKTTINPKDSLINQKPCSSKSPREICEYTFGSERMIEHGMDKDPAREECMRETALHVSMRGLGWHCPFAALGPQRSH